MQFLLSVVIVFVVSGLLLVGSLRAVGPKKKGWLIDRPKRSEAKAKLRGMLEELSKSKKPTDLNMGAMCYSMMLPSGVRAVVCSKCGDRTVYDIGGNYNHSDLVHSMRIAQSITNDLAEFTVTVDTTRFCPKCADEKPIDDKWDSFNESLKKEIQKEIDNYDDPKKPVSGINSRIGLSYDETLTLEKLIRALKDMEKLKSLKSKNFMDNFRLIVTYEETKETRTVPSDKPTLKALQALIQHKNRIKSDNDRETPLKDFESKLRVLLNIPK